MADTIARVGRVVGRAPDVASLPARLALGSTMAYHGLQKLGREGRAQTAQMMEGLGLRPSRFWSLATGVAETCAGVAMLLGLAAKPAALAVLVTQSVAIAKVHAPKGFANTQGGMEFNLALIAIALGALLTGPGAVSAHTLIERRFAPAPRGLLRRTRPTRLAAAVHYGLI